MARFSTTRAEAGRSRSATWTTGTFSPPSRISEVKRKRFPSGRKNGQPCQEKRSFSGASTGASAPPAAFTRWIAPAIETRMTPSRLQVPLRPGASGSVAIVRETPVPTSTADRRPANSAAISFPSGREEGAARPVRAREESRLEARERADEDAVLRRVGLVESHEAAVGRQCHPRPLRVPGFEGEADHPRTGLLGDLLSAGEIAPPRRGRVPAATGATRRSRCPRRGSRRRRGRCLRQPLGEEADPRLPDVAQAQLRVALEAALEQAAHAPGGLRRTAPPTAARGSGPRRARRSPSRPRRACGRSASRRARPRRPRCRPAGRPPSRGPAPATCRRRCRG